MNKLLVGSDALTSYLGLIVGAAIEVLSALDALPNIGAGWHIAAVVAVAVGRVLNIKKSDPAAPPPLPPKP